MDGIQETRNFPGKSGRECYEAGLAAFTKAGYQIWKKRDLAWFAIANRKDGDREITANFMSKPGKETSVVVGISAANTDEAQLHRYADEYFEALRITLGM